MNRRKAHRIDQIMILAVFFASSRLFGAELSLKDAIRIAIKNHPQTSADKFREESSEKDITRKRSAYYPQLYAEALETSGFPGSSGSSLGIGGLMGSPYRSGPTVGVLLEQDIFDFGRTSASVSVAEKGANLSKAESKVNSLQIGIQTSKIYATCAYDRSLFIVYQDQLREAKLIQEEVAKFVATGQRTIVDKYLSQCQTEEIETKSADFSDRISIDEERLGMILGLPNESSSCPILTEQLSKDIPLQGDAALESSPLMLRARGEVDVARSEAERSRKEYYPRVVGLASAGYLDGTQLGVPRQNYSVGVGLVIPLFEGFKTNAEVQGSRAHANQKEDELSATRLDVNETLLGIEGEIRSAEIRINHLRHELNLAETAFKTAKERYFFSSGTLVDLRDALMNLGRVQTDKKAAEAQHLVKLAEKGLVTGSLLKEAPK